jgi:hypothetical protein
MDDPVIPATRSPQGTPALVPIMRQSHRFATLTAINQSTKQVSAACGLACQSSGFLAANLVTDEGLASLYPLPKLIGERLEMMLEIEPGITGFHAVLHEMKANTVRFEEFAQFWSKRRTSRQARGVRNIEVLECCLPGAHKREKPIECRTTLGDSPDIAIGKDI